VCRFEAANLGGVRRVGSVSSARVIRCTQSLALEEKVPELSTVLATRFRRAHVGSGPVTATNRNTDRQRARMRSEPERRCDMDSRRRVPRHVAGWTGSCHIDDDTVDKLWECEVLDISELGLAILLQHSLGVQLIGRRISVQSPTASTSVNIRLEGDVRNAVPVGDDAVRLGIEFVGLTELEQTVVRALGNLNLTG
jgi:hypothetical protein